MIAWLGNKTQQEEPMQSEYGTEQYKKQVDAIYTAISTSDFEAEELDQALMLYIMDMSYHRAAISEARKRLMKEHFGVLPA